MPEPSGRAARRPRRAKWILKDCWCMRLQVAVLIIALLTAAIAAILFVYYLHCIMINVWGKDIFHLQKNLVKEYNDSMLKASKDFNRSLRSLRRVRHWLTSTSRRPGGRGPRPGPRSLFDLGAIPPRFFRVFFNTPRMAADPQNVDNPAGYFGHKRLRRAFEDRAFRRQMDAKQTERQTRYQQKSRTSSKGRRGAVLPSVGRAMGALWSRVSGAARGRLTRQRPQARSAVAGGRRLLRALQPHLLRLQTRGASLRVQGEEGGGGFRHRAANRPRHSHRTSVHLHSTELLLPALHHPHVPAPLPQHGSAGGGGHRRGGGRRRARRQVLVRILTAPLAEELKSFESVVSFNKTANAKSIFLLYGQGEGVLPRNEADFSRRFASQYWREFEMHPISPLQDIATDL